jgi:hypothetical protein
VVREWAVKLANMADSELLGETQSRIDWAGYLEEIQSIGGTNPLRNFELNPHGQLDLERTHPGGYSQLITGRPTLLSNLFRDPLAYSKALASARRIKSRSNRLRDHFGLDSLHLIGGVADFTGDGIDLSIPILIWPIQAISRSDDYEFEISGEPFVNPELLLALKNHFDIDINERELLARQLESSDLIPVTLLNYLAYATSAKANLALRRVLVISNFVPTLTQVIQDFKAVESSVIQALNGSPSDGLQPIDLPELTLVADADATQMRIIARALAGQNFAVETLPGCGYVQTVVNVLANLALVGKRTLVVAPRQQTLAELADRLSEVGLAALGVRSDFAWVDFISAISRNEKAQVVDANVARNARLAAEKNLDAYFETLNTPDAKLGISLAQALQNLAALTVLPHPPETSSRIDRAAIDGGLNREDALELLHEAADLGEFAFGPQDTAWFQAQFDSPEEVEATLRVARRLHQESYPKLSEQLTEFIRSVNFKPAETVEDWGLYLRLFMGIRETLDRFVSDVFDRPLTELIAATSPRKGFTKDRSMSGSNRRRLKKLAKEYLRPGMSVSDMNSALKSVDEQRQLWAQYSMSPVPPSVPVGINDALVAYQSFVADLEQIQQHLDPLASELPLVKLPLFDLQKKVQSLAEDTEALQNLGERSLVLNKIRKAGLGLVARDLAKLHTPKERIITELELAWWQSALEAIVARDKSILGYVPELLEQNESQFRAAYETQVSVGAQIVTAELGERWRKALAALPAEASALKQLLKTGTASLKEATAVAPGIVPILSPAVMMSPYQVATHIGPTEKFDVVVVLDAAGSTVAENMSALIRSAQIIAFGDDAISEPTGFETEIRPSVEISPEKRSSVFQEARRLFGQEVLRRSYRTTGQALSELINREFYQDRIEFTPSAAEFFGEKNFNVEVITKDNRANSTIEGATESLDAEVDQVAELVFNHALWHPEKSLLVASASAIHAERIRAAVKKGLQTRPQISEFFDAHGREKFEVTSLSELTHRLADRVIFSIGFGRTQHGAVLSNFGELSSENGRRHLANLLVSARRQITVVSCFGAEDVPTDRLSNGALLLRELLEAADKDRAEVLVDSDPMLQDLTIRLKKLGIRVDSSFSLATPLIASYGKKAAVIEPDWNIPGSIRTEKFRLRPRLLESLGWEYFRVYSFELFSDPQALAHRIAIRLGMQIGKQAQPLFDERAFEDTDTAWGDTSASNDYRLKGDKPPHWG